MAAAFAYDLYENRETLSLNDAALIGVGFLAAFVADVFVVRSLLDFVSKHSSALFAWWWIIVGAAGLIGLGILS